MLTNALLAAVSLIPFQVVAPTSTAKNPDFGTFAPTIAAPQTDHLGLVVGRTTELRVDGASPGEIAVLALSSSALAVPVPLGGGLLELDPAAIFLVAPAVADAAGSATWRLALRRDTPVGLPAIAQAAVLDAAGGSFSLTGATRHESTDLAPTVLWDGVKTTHPLGQEPFAPAVLLVTDPAAFAAEWRAAGIAAAPPAVDFQREVVFFAFAGRVPTTGYSLDVTDLEPLAPGVRVQQRLNAPGPGCGAFFGETNPFEVVSVDRVAGGVPAQVAQSVVPMPPCP